MPACPFAKRAWVDDRVGFILKDESFDVLFEAIYKGQKKDVIILITI